MYKIKLSTGEYDVRDILDCAKGYYIKNEQGEQVFIAKTHQDELAVREAVREKQYCPNCGSNVYTKRFTVLPSGTQVIKCLHCNVTFNE